MRINDPVFKNRVVIGNKIEVPKRRNWMGLIIIILIITIIGSLIYLFPKTTHNYINVIKNQFQKVESEPEPEPKIILEPVKTIPQVEEKTEVSEPKKLKPEEQLSDEVKTLLIQAQQQIKRGRLTNPKTNSAYVIYQKIVPLAPNAAVVQDLLNDIINSLFARAERQMTKQQYTTPDHDNALNTYQKILRISPNNIKAQNGIIEIANAYYKLAQKKQQQKRYKSSLFWINKGLEVKPDDVNLNQLKLEIMEHIK
jgi:tetratricopeptide (TPR) repeat protein